MKPRCKLVGEDGNIFNLMAIASRALKEVGLKEESDEMVKRVTTEAKNYLHALAIIMEYVDIY